MTEMLVAAIVSAITNKRVRSTRSAILNIFDILFTCVFYIAYLHDTNILLNIQYTSASRYLKWCFVYRFLGFVFVLVGL